MLQLVGLTDAERTGLEAVQRATRRAREWRRMRAVQLLSAGREASEVAQVLGCNVSSIYYWAADWREQGLAGLVEGPHAGRPRRLAGDAEQQLDGLLSEDPQAHGYASCDWTVPLLRTELARQGQLLSERTLRRALHRLGWRCTAWGGAGSGPSTCSDGLIRPAAAQYRGRRPAAGPASAPRA